MGALKIHSSSDSLDELTRLANEEATAAEQCGTSAVVHAWQCGQHLSAIKQKVGHGNFGEWLNKNWRMTPKRAYQFMDIALLKMNRCSNLTSINEALRICQQEAKPKIRQQIKEYIEQNPNCTDKQIAAGVGEKPASVRGRRNELCKDGEVKKSGSAKGGKRPSATYVVVPESERITSEPDTDEHSAISLAQALRSASKRNSVNAEYLANKTGIAKAKIQAWLELSAEACAYKAVIQDDKTFAIHKQRIQSDNQFVKSVKSQSIHGDATPAEALASDLDSIGNKIEGVLRLYSPGCKDFPAWNRLTADDRKNLRFLLSSAMSKVEKHFPFFIGLVSE